MTRSIVHFKDLLSARITNFAKRVAAADTEQSNLFPSQAVRSKYKVEGLIGRGGFGYVWLCLEKATKLKFACKVIDKTRIKDEVSRQSCEREVSVMRQLSAIGHVGLVQLRDVFESETKLELVMEYCSGGDLYDKVSDQGALSEDEAKALFRQVVEAVDFCHQHGVVHRDIKAGNVLLAYGEKMQAKLCDFGLATTFTEGQLMSESVGTKYWAAPEIMEGQKYDQGVDVWSLGVFLFCMLTGKLPPSKGGPTKDAKLWKSFLSGHVRFDLVDCSSFSPEAFDVLERMLQYKPVQRLRIQDILQHRWLANAKCSMHSLSRTRSLRWYPSFRVDAYEIPTSVALKTLCASPQSSCNSLL